MQVKTQTCSKQPFANFSSKRCTLQKRCFFYFVAFTLVPATTAQMKKSESNVVPEFPQSNLTVYNNSQGEFYACFKLQLPGQTICANSSQTHVRITNGDGQVLFDVRETAKYEFRRIGNISLVKFKDETKERRLLVNNFVFDSPEQVHPTYLAEIDENEFIKQAKALMTNGDVDSMAPLADAIDELDLSEEQKKAARPVVILAMNAIRAESSKVNGELKMNDSEYIGDTKHRRNKRHAYCPSYKRQPEGKECLGRCGPGCTCWSIFCGDCCYHQGSYDHDMCCEKGFVSLGCLSPIRLLLHFSCSHGYPNCGRDGCFPAQATVQRKNSKATTLKDLRVGDEVLTVNDEGREVYTKVLAFLDFKPHSLQTNLRLHFTDGQSLTVSERHLVFKRDGGTKVAVFAEEIAVGDYLFKYSKLHKSLQAIQVVSVEETQVHGAYAPLTEHGTLLVDGVFTSCYAQIRSHRVAHFALAPLRLWKSWFPSKEVQNGIHSYAERLQKGVKWFKLLFPKPVSDVFG